MHFKNLSMTNRGMSCATALKLVDSTIRILKFVLNKKKSIDIDVTYRFILVLSGGHANGIYS